ncbi:transposase [Zavarzinella formosa]|uniref:transposase n=1 Tax=Zavarzinella formosa TaxID=360055 RepID=UPI00035FD63A|nr:transposase [Zavarzinella formosa]
MTGLESLKTQIADLAYLQRMTDSEAYEMIKNLRWLESDGRPECPRCDSRAIYEYRSRQIFKCKECRSQFSVTSGTAFASRKLSHRDILISVAVYLSESSGVRALNVSRLTGKQYKTTFVLLNKLREAMAPTSDEWIGDRYLLATARALASPVSRDWKAYWQRSGAYGN